MHLAFARTEAFHNGKIKKKENLVCELTNHTNKLEPLSTDASTNVWTS